jgi:uncharacterized ion transporter superfamily protein YfcC
LTLIFTLAQVNIPTDPPTTVAATLFLIVVLFLTNWIYTKGAYNDQKERADRLENALELQREATQTALEATRELRDLGRLMRRVLEALPQVDDTPTPPPGRRR